MSKITVIQTNKNKKDFQSRVFQLEITWEEFKNKVIHNDSETNAYGTMYGRISRGETVEININDDFHLEVVKECGVEYNTVASYYLVGEEDLNRFLEYI